MGGVSSPAVAVPHPLSSSSLKPKTSVSKQKPKPPTMHCFKFHHHPFLFSPPLNLHPKTLTLAPKTLTLKPPNSSAYGPDELPVDEEFLAKYAPKDRESEDEARRRNWIERGWAPWEEILTPEADFARKSLNEGEEIPLQSPEAIEAFKMLTPSYRRKKMEETGMSEDELLAKQFEIKGEIPEKLETKWAGPLGLRMMPPRDWPPRGWEVDEGELGFIREAHRMSSERVDLDGEVEEDKEKLGVERYEVFLKQYKEWVEANRDRLEEESFKVH